MADSEKKTSLATVKAMAVFVVGTHLLRFMFSSVYFKQVGLPSSYSGILLGLSRITEALGGVIFGYAADRANMRNSILKFCYLAYAVTPFLITLPQPTYVCNNETLRMNGSEQNSSQLASCHNKTTLLCNTPNISSESVDLQESKKLFILLLIIIGLGDFLGGATINIMDTLAVSSIEDKKQYGKIRLWGNIGQAVTIPVVAIITYFKEIEICGVLQSDYRIALYATSLVSSIGWFVAIFKVNMPPSKTEDESDNNKEEVSIKDLVVPLEMWSLLVNALFYGIFIGAVSGFLFWTMTDLDPTQANLSIAVANFLRNATSLLVYYYAPRLLTVAGYRTILNGSCVVFGASFVVASFMRTSWLGIAVEILTSGGKALAMAACVSYIGEMTHPSLAVTAQGLLHLMFTGAGPAIGPFLTGFIMEYTGQTITFIIFAGLSILVLIFSVIVQFIMKMRHREYEQMSAEQELE